MANSPQNDATALARDGAGDSAPPARFFGRRPKLQGPSEALQPETPPPPPPSPHRRRPTLSALSGFLSFLLLVAFAGLFGVVWGAHRLQQPGPLKADKVFYIEPGTEVADIVAQLQDEGVIDSPLIFNVALLVEGNRSRVKAGEYLIHQRASMSEVMDTLVSGRQILHSVTIPEGLTSEQVVGRLRANDVLLGEIRETPPEGSLLPETYKVPRGMARADLIRRMQQDDRKLVAQIWAHRAANLGLHSPYELVTLASIVEKETGKPDERPHVAAVFLNRLRRHMRLQSDPTIVYGLIGGKGTLGRPLTRADVEKPSPYNTYLIAGLPPGPITNPGRASLEAVANPMQSDDLYFVADGTGGHVFSATFEQHQRNVARWRQIEKEAKDKAAPPIDKYVPPAGHDQRGDLDNGNSVYGALPTSFNTASANAYTPNFGMGAAAAALAQVTPTMPRAASRQAPAIDPVAEESASVTPMASGPGAIHVGAGLSSLDVRIRGVDQPEAAAKLLDGPVDSSASVQPADPKLYAESTAAQPAAAAGRQPPLHPHIFDASEGTPLDPLRDTTYDLNYPKTVPPPSTLKN